MTINRDRFLADTTHRREAIEFVSAQLRATCQQHGFPITDSEATRAARDLLARAFDSPAMRDAKKFPA